MKEKVYEIYAGTIRSAGYARQGFAGVGIGSGIFFAPVFSGDHVIGMVFYLLGWGCLI